MYEANRSSLPVWITTFCAESLILSSLGEKKHWKLKLSAQWTWSFKSRSTEYSLYIPSLLRYVSFCWGSNVVHLSSPLLIENCVCRLLSSFLFKYNFLWAASFRILLLKSFLQSQVQQTYWQWVGHCSILLTRLVLTSELNLTIGGSPG